MKIILALFFTFSFLVLSLSNGLFFNLSEANAQTLDPTLWQTQATGLKTQTNPNKKTGGLGFVVADQGWPFIFQRGGIENQGNGAIGGPVGIELGQIKIPGVTGSFVGETVDWAHNEMNFTNLKLTVSRLSPAIALETQSNSLILFSGTLSGDEYYTNQWSQTDIRQITRLSFPKYIAYSSAGTVRVQTLTTSSLDLSSLDKNWILLWYGTNSHFLDSKRPLGYYGSLKLNDGYQADTPILFVFQNLPSSIKHSTDGGVELAFPSSAGSLALLPILGRNNLPASQTETWVTNLPQAVIDKTNFWASHLCSFPTTASENYSYNSSTDTVTITENVTFIPICAAGTTFAPFPPLLAIAKNALGINFPSTITDGNLPTEYGPMLGIENVSSYTWSVSGLKKYTETKRNLATGQVPGELEQKLNSEVNKITTAGHYAPWTFLDVIPSWASRGDLYWANPADIVYHLTEVAPALSDPFKTNLINYIKSERTNYPPEDVYDLSLKNGKIRNYYNFFGFEWDYYWSGKCSGTCPAPHYQRVPIYNFYSLAKYYDLTSETIPANLFPKAQNALDRDMKEKDWATSYWFLGSDNFYSRPESVTVANRHLAGILGFINLAKSTSNSQAESLGRSLLAKEVTSRVAMALYPRYLYSAGLIELPSNPKWQTLVSSSASIGHFYNTNWQGPYDDARQIAALNQFEVFLHEETSYKDWGSPFFITYREMVPEVAQLLSDYAKQDSLVSLKKTEEIYPAWFASFSPGRTGSEHNLEHPVNSFQTFMAKALIEKDFPQNLAKYADISWLEEGDLFYIQKLAEVVKAYKGWSWSDVTPPSHCQPLGNIDCSGTVNVLDLSMLISRFGSSDSFADLDDSGKVNVIDLSILLANFGN